MLAGRFKVEHPLCPVSYEFVSVRRGALVAVGIGVGVGIVAAALVVAISHLDDLEEEDYPELEVAA